MLRIKFFPLVIVALVQISLSVALSRPCLAQEWTVRRPRGTLKVVDLRDVADSVKNNYAEGLVMLDRDANFVPCLAEDWRWIDDRTIEFKLRRGVFFHNGETFNAEVVRVNWEQYRRMENPQTHGFLELPDATIFEVIDEYKVRLTFPEPDGLALVKLQWLFQFAPAFYTQHKFDEFNYGYLPEAGPWGTGPFELVEGGLRWAKPSERLVLKAHKDYWDPRYPKVQKLIFDNTLIGDRKEAMRLCRETEGQVDIVTHIRPLDTLKVAESPFAKVVKCKDVSLLGGMFNQRKQDSKWRDVRLRRAVNYAINRKELWKYAAKGNAYNLEGYQIPPGAYGHNPDLPPWTYDTTKARALLAEAGYPDGFEVKVITFEAWKLETQIIKRMLWRIGLEVKLDVLTFPELIQKCYIPILDKPPEEQDWDIVTMDAHDWFGHTGASFLPWLTDEGDWRWNEYDQVYEEMWKDMVRTVDPEAQEEKVRQLVKYHYDRAYYLFIYSPLSLYAVNKEVNFVPQKSLHLRLKETSVTDNHWYVRKEQAPDEE